MKKKKEIQITPTPTALIIENKIYLIRGQKVMLDSDLAEIYEVTTGNLNLAVRRHPLRFPEDFTFRLTDREYDSLILQSARSKKGRGGRRHLPYVFTEHGVAMLSSVLTSVKAVQMNIYIVRAFIKMREKLAVDKNLEIKLLNFQAILRQQGKDIDDIIDKLNWLTDEPLKPLGPLGFQP